ncbi:RNA-directed DNA polymerase, eukaryota, reverse transcriptase zinc-binding domain protein [Tanacetum coccineum]|uniref:RNA-directed DNA polymerase, eukaryota, reverse transcriptase zinc-binding domain protein n=1 Tax=Tanacetum coccineum TaxID=301880 RepID=A0ABQ5DI53_9ASTR
MIFEAIKYFFTCGEIPKGCNSTFIALIPKNPDANMVKDFRPISLIGSIYKIIAKILTNRLVGVLGDIVNEVQSAFISERQILDGPFILNEIMQWCRKRKKQSLIFKVNFEKAYDSVRWDFLEYIMAQFLSMESYGGNPIHKVSKASYMGTIPETFPQTVLAGHNQYKVLFKQDDIPTFEYTLQFSATFKLPWILSFTHKKKEVEGTSPPLLIRQFSAKWWKVIKESQADKAAVDRYYKSLIPRTTSVSPSSSVSGSSMTNKEIA